MIHCDGSCGRESRSCGVYCFKSFQSLTSFQRQYHFRWNMALRRLPLPKESNGLFYWDWDYCSKLFHIRVLCSVHKE